MNILALAATSTLLAATLAGPAAAERRFAPIDPAAMSPEQRAVWDAIANGPRKSTGGPFNAWLRSPVLADRLQKVGEYVRFQSSLPKRLNEFAILITGRYWGSGFEWDYHYPLAIQAGVPAGVLADLAAGRQPADMSEDEALIYVASTELRRDRNISDATYAKLLQKFGERGVLDLVAVNGYYDLVCMTLNVAEVPVPAGSKVPPLPPLPKPTP